MDSSKTCNVTHLPSALDFRDLILLEYSMILFPCSFSMRISTGCLFTEILSGIGLQGGTIKIHDMAYNLDISILYGLHFKRMLISQDFCFILLGKDISNVL